MTLARVDGGGRLRTTMPDLPFGLNERCLKYRQVFARKGFGSPGRQCPWRAHARTKNELFLNRTFREVDHQHWNLVLLLLQLQPDLLLQCFEKG